MKLQKRSTFYAPASLAVAAAGLIGTSPKFDQFDNNHFWEEMLIHVYLTADATTAPGTLTADGVLGAVRNINLAINDGVKPRACVNFSGIGMLEYVQQVGLNSDVGTLALISEHTKASPGLTTSNLYHLCYRIPFVHPMIDEPLRTRMLLPVPNHKATPILTVDFASAAQMYGAGSITSLVSEIEVVRREVPDSLNDAILKDGGYFDFDLLETVFTPGVGVSGEQRFDIPLGGAYAGLNLRHYLGGATVSRADISETTTRGSETRWRIERQGATMFDWRNSHLKAQNDRSRVLNSALQASSPSIGAKLAASTQYQGASSLYLDFLGDNLNGANDLGSLLDCFAPDQRSNKVQIVTNIANTATNGSKLYIGGHRFLNADLVRKFQLLKA